MITAESVQLSLIIASLAMLLVIVGIIFVLVFKMGVKYGVYYEKNKRRRYDEVRHNKSVSQYCQNDVRDTGTGSVRVRKPKY